MQNQQPEEEEFYKMKYYKYKAKYHKLLEQQGGIKMPSFSSVTSGLKTAASGLSTVASGVASAASTASNVASKTASSVASKAIEAKKSYERSQEQANKERQQNINKLFEDIRSLLALAYPRPEEDNYKLYRLIGQLEQPCKFQSLLDIVTNVKGTNNDVIQRKNSIADRINKLCSTTLGGLNAECRMVVKSPNQRGGNDSESLDTIDDFTFSDF
jgi:X-X-X-Leu-X-X-Gly heptad repeat protein